MAERLSLVLLGLGYQMDMLLMSTGGQFRSSDNAIEAMFIISFLCYTLAFLTSLLINFTEWRETKGILIANIGLSFIAGLFLIVGLALVGSRSVSNSAFMYQNTIYSTSLIFAILSGVLLSLVMTGVVKQESVTEGP